MVANPWVRLASHATTNQSSGVTAPALAEYWGLNWELVELKTRAAIVSWLRTGIDKCTLSGSSTMRGPVTASHQSVIVTHPEVIGVQ